MKSEHIYTGIAVIVLLAIVMLLANNYNFSSDCENEGYTSVRGSMGLKCIDAKEINL